MQVASASCKCNLLCKVLVAQLGMFTLYDLLVYFIQVNLDQLLHNALKIHSIHKRTLTDLEGVGSAVVQEVRVEPMNIDAYRLTFP